MDIRNILKNGITIGTLLLGSVIPQRSDAVLMDYPCAVPIRVRTYEGYKVKKGENLWTITDRIYGARRIYHPDLERNIHLPTLIARVNKIPAPYYVHEGQELYLPHEEVAWKAMEMCVESVVGNRMDTGFKF